MKKVEPRCSSLRAAAFAFLTVMVGLLFPSNAPLFAQATSGRVLGTVTDASGGAIAGATVIVTDVDRNIARTLTTDQSGEYNAPNLLPGNYKVRAEAKGFKAFERTSIILEVAGEIRVDLVMQPGDISQTITVTEAVPMIETTNAELGATLQSAIIADVPLNGRNFENLIQLNPGVMIYPGGSGGTQSANGMRAHDNVYLVNGIMASEPWTGQSVFNGVMAAGDAGTILPVDAIDEFKTEENPRAEFGWKPGAIVNVGIKSGTNGLHGSAYAYGRDTAFDARNYFNPDPTPKVPVALEQFGAFLGGPIKKDKLFYFVNYESQRYGIGNPAQVATFETTPGGGTKKSLIDACNAALTAGKLTALSASLAGLDTSCNPLSSALTTDPGGLQFQGLFPVSSSGIINSALVTNNIINGGLAKVDYRPDDKNQFEGMYFISEGNNSAVDNPGPEISTNWLSAQHARSMAASGEWVYTSSSSRINELRFGYAHYYQTFFGTDINQNPADYDFNGYKVEMPTGLGGSSNPLFNGFPGLSFSGAGVGITIGVGWPKIIGPDGVLEISDSYSILKGKHAFKFGGGFIYDTSDNLETSNGKGPIRFNTGGGNTTLENFFEGDLNRARLMVGNAQRYMYANSFDGFVQDDWRIKPRLTVNLGLRYELDGVVHDKNGQMGNFDPIEGVYQTNSPYQGDHNNFGPRVGLAWDIFGDGKTVLRAAGGILYEQLSFDVLNGVGNLLGLRTMPTGLPDFNSNSTTPLPINGNITLQSLQFTGPALGTMDTAWKNFNPALPVAGQATFYASAASNAACGNSVTNVGLAFIPGQCEIFGVTPNLRTPYVNNWNLDIQHAITSNLSLDVGYVGNHGSKLLGKVELNQPEPGSGWTPAAIAGCIASAPTCAPDPSAELAAEPFTAPCAGTIGIPGAVNSPGGPFNPANKCFSFLSYITIANNGYESNYDGLEVTLTGRNYHGLSFTAGYTYSHALGQAGDQGTSGDYPAPENSYASPRELYTSTQFDVRQRFTLSVNYAIPGKKGFGQLLEGWGLNSVVIIQSGLPWGGSDVTDDFSGTGELNSQGGAYGEQWNFFGKPSDFTPVHGFTNTNGGVGGVPYSGDDSTGAILANCVAADAAHYSGQQLQLAMASLANLGCYGVGSSVMLPPAYGSYGNMNHYDFRDAGFKNWDMSVTKLFTLKERLKAEFKVEFFNVLNHPDFSNPSGGPGGAVGDPSGGPPFGFSGLTPDTYSSNPQLGSGGARAMQLGLKLAW
jgi:hypothetical protein